MPQGVVIIGVQWGDEGKGKIVDYYASSADIVARFQGGNNAGHTLVVDGKQTILHLIPSVSCTRIRTASSARASWSIRKFSWRRLRS